MIYVLSLAYKTIINNAMKKKLELVMLNIDFKGQFANDAGGV